MQQITGNTGSLPYCYWILVPVKLITPSWIQTQILQKALQVHKWRKTNKKMFIHTFEIEAQIYQALLPRMHLPESPNAQRLIMIHTSYGG